ncbi:Sec1 family domain-containing protein 1 [Heterocephalus glaber]|uniref:Sec1 family domain-containing protein 1 n=1 Tax=Heterocephalus glaber TaxID=10181 RepID=G5CAM4_HETGA|nr:Sec1 family domain-containing protein 1 [Heterocephalus glaber]
MLNFNVPHVKNSTGEPVWKVLIYDRFGQDIISPLLSVKELRDMGITLHLLLHSDRDPIPDVPAVYFVMPTEENIDRMCQDLRNQLYESYYLNFISAISRSKLEDIANAALAASAVTQVAKVFDQYLNFITLEDDMFVLCNQNKELVSYRAINRPDITDTEMETVMDTIVDSLFCFFVTLDQAVCDFLALQNDHESFQRPLLVLVDRNIDLATPLHHTWTYQALVHDVLDFHLNRVNLEESSGVENSPAGARPKRKNKKSYDLTPVDKFWQKHKGSPFPEVAESVQQELEYYRAQEDEVKRLKSIMGLEGEDEGAISMLSDNTAKLTSAVRAFAKMASAPASYGNTTAKPMGLLSRVMNTGSQFVMEGVKNLVLKQQGSDNQDSSNPGPNQHQSQNNISRPGVQWEVRNSNQREVGSENLPVTRILDNLMEMKSNPETDDYRYFDPKMLRGSDSSVPRNKNPFQEGKQGKHILYGCSELFNATQFMRQVKCTFSICSFEIIQVTVDSFLKRGGAFIHPKQLKSKAIQMFKFFHLTLFSLSQFFKVEVIKSIRQD